MATQTNRIMDLLLAGHQVGDVADLLDVTPESVLTVAQDLTATPSALQAQVPPNVTTLAPVSGTALQDATDLPSEVYVPITGGASGTATVAIGPTSGVADTIINAEAATANHTVHFRLPAGWYFKVTVGGSAAIASGTLQVNG